MLKNEMERRLDLEDRGEVSSVFGWTAVCGRCAHPAHIVILKDERRSYACPRCLVVLDVVSDRRDIDDVPAPKRAYRDGKINRIKKYGEEFL